MLRVGTCGVCGTGNIGVRVAASGRCVVGMCDECDAVWVDARLESSPHCPEQPDLPCPGDGSSLRHDPAHWADRDEASAGGWGDAVLEEARTFG
jgi:hypothetical protein